MYSLLIKYDTKCNVHLNAHPLAFKFTSKLKSKIKLYFLLQHPFLKRAIRNQNRNVIR